MTHEHLPALFAAVFLTVPVAFASFSDVPKSHPYKDAIDYAQAESIVSGYPDSGFKPENKVTRAELVKIVLGAANGYDPRKDPAGFDIYSLSQVHFRDAQAGAWYVPYLRVAAQAEIIAGYSDGTFKPGNHVTFAEASKMIVNAFDLETQKEQESSTWYEKYVRALTEIQAIPPSIKSFSHRVTRGEMVEMIFRVREKITNKNSLAYDEIENQKTAVSISKSSLKSPKIESCPIFPADNPWNRDISDAPLHPNSQNFIDYIVQDGRPYLHADFGGGGEYGIPYIVVGNEQEDIPVNVVDYADESDPGPYPIPANAPIENGGDAHVIVVDKDDCMLYELFAASHENGKWNASSAAKFDLRSNELRPEGWTSADAAGLPIFAGLVRYDEVEAGEINHALRFTVSKTQRAYIRPATHYASSITDPNAPPMGLRLRLKADYDISGYTGQSRVVLEALKKYGMILADNGSDWFITGSSDARWSDDDLNQLKKIPGAAFEAVDTTDVP